MMIEKDGEVFIRTPAELERYIKMRKEGKLYARREDGTLFVDHRTVATAMMKFVQLSPIEPTIKKILLMRMGSPLVSGSQYSHTKIALSLGITVDEVKEMEQHGVELVGKLLQRFDPKEQVKAFEHDSVAQKILASEINKLTKTEQGDKNDTSN